ncbi:MAG: pirin family protein [candidate division KSB1 bacterium]|jgi:redox-sensitive bicupin YhaK (pirin superfamily)|nr:pirin family protein [candidate division KSB1 bacterium]
MSITHLIIDERSRDIGDFLVGRFLPFREKRMVGPFIFLDHMGPSQLGKGRYLDVDQHPHIGLSTLTYLLEGEIEHRDSLGTVQRITPGDVNLMNAGSGVTHTERTPQELRQHRSVVHGYQIWLALPLENEDVAPQFHHVAGADLPEWNEGDASFKLIVGEAFGRKSPVPVCSHMFMMEIDCPEAFTLDVSDGLHGEIGIMVTEGLVRVCDSSVAKGRMLVTGSEDTCQVEVSGGSKIFLLGGEPFPEERYIDWNFVSHSKKKLQTAKEDWLAWRFPVVPGDASYVPYPNKKA